MFVKMVILSAVLRLFIANRSSKVPCEVKYTKPSGSQILWSANHEVGYCESKATAFAAKLDTLGWSCSKVNNTMTE